MNTIARKLQKMGAVTVSTLALTGAAHGVPLPPPPRAPLPPPPPRAAPAPVPAQATAPAPQPGGVTVTTASSLGALNRATPFFQPFGNGRSCESCHQPGQGWSVTPDALQARFNASGGTDPVFRLLDGANSPAERTQTLAQRQTAYGMLLRYGVIRVGLPMPSVADFTLQTVEDPYGYASALELSLFRRPLPSTNLRHQATVMWDLRETLPTVGGPNCIAGTTLCFADVLSSLSHQANAAVKGHALFTPGLTDAQLQAVVNFEASLTTAASSDAAAGSLSASGARGGPAQLATMPFYFGINDPVVGDYRTKAAFNPRVFTLYNAWAPSVPGGPSPAGLTPAQAAIGRGQMIFNTRPFNIAGVNGFNDELNRPAVRGTCSSCHNAPNVGSASVPRLMDTGTAAAARRTPDQPLYTFRNPATGALLRVSDPGLALQTGKWRDIGKFKVPGLRGLAAHPPYFHDGHAPDLGAVVGFYDRRFGIGLSPQERADLVAFLRAL